MKSSRKIAEVEKLINIGKEKGYLTYDQVNEYLPSDILSGDQLDDVMTMFGDMEIEIIDSAKKIKYQKQKDTETAEEDEEGEEEEKEVETPAVGKTNDPVRLYLREMGMVNLLTREGEVEIAKRIEAGEHQVRKEAIHTPSAIQESLLLADRIRSDWVEMKDILKNFDEESNGDEQARVQQEKILSVLSEVSKLHQENLRIKASLRKRRHTEAHYKVKKTRTEKNRALIGERLMRTPFNARQLDRIVQRLKSHLQKIEQYEKKSIGSRRKPGSLSRGSAEIISSSC